MKITTLFDCVKQEHNSNITEAAKRFGTTRATIYTWIGAGALVIDGEVYTKPKISKK